eukprot:m.176553 g.176553  ORF g.176553 m.176553 type:complete len:99 (-) comp53350_c0_seq3:32-328(-)
MLACWEEAPRKRPPFSDLSVAFRALSAETSHLRVVEPHSPALSSSASPFTYETPSQRPDMALTNSEEQPRYARERPRPPSAALRAPHETVSSVSLTEV